MASFQSDASSAEAAKEPDDNADIKTQNREFFKRRIERRRENGTLIPGGYEESNYMQEQLQTKAERDRRTLAERLQAGVRKLLGVPNS
jgi:hypothetical protein